MNSNVVGRVRSACISEVAVSTFTGRVTPYPCTFFALVTV